MEERIFDRKLNQLGIVLTEEMKEQFDRYYEMLVEWNKVNGSRLSGDSPEDRLSPPEGHTSGLSKQEN